MLHSIDTNIERKKGYRVPTRCGYRGFLGYVSFSFCALFIVSIGSSRMGCSEAISVAHGCSEKLIVRLNPSATLPTKTEELTLDVAPTTSSASVESSALSYEHASLVVDKPTTSVTIENGEYFPRMVNSSRDNTAIDFDTANNAAGTAQGFNGQNFNMQSDISYDESSSKPTQYSGIGMGTAGSLYNSTNAEYDIGEAGGVGGVGGEPTNNFGGGGNETTFIRIHHGTVGDTALDAEASSELIKTRTRLSGS